MIRDRFKPIEFIVKLVRLQNIMDHNSLSQHFKLLGEFSSKMCKFKMKSLDSMNNLYRSTILVHDQQQFKRYFELVIFSTPNTTTYT